MMRWWLDRGVDGFRMDVINMISKDPALPDGRSRDGVVPVTAARTSSAARGCTSSWPEMHREVLRGAAGELLTVGEMPGSRSSEARLFTDPARAELDMVFQFEHVALDHGRVQMGPAAAATCPT